jgi:hypothetical protein
MRPIRIGDVYSLPSTPRFAVSFFDSWQSPTHVCGVGRLPSGVHGEMRFTVGEIRAGVLVDGGTGEALEET